MSQPDLVAQLRAARPVATPELRERVRLVASRATLPPRGRITWRRAAVLAVPVAAAIAAAVVLVPHGRKQAAPLPATPPAMHAVEDTSTSFAAGTAKASVATSVPAPSATRLQRYAASLALELRTPAALAAASQRAVAIAVSLGGYQQTVVVRAAGKTGYAEIVLRVPVGNVREAVRRLATLGTITAEDVSIQDLQVQMNTTAVRIAQLRAQLATLEAQPQTAEQQRRVASLTAQIDRLERARTATVRAGRYATVSLQLATPEAAIPVRHGHGPLHGIAVAFRWVGIGAVYALALGTPLVALLAAAALLARAVRRRREARLLSSR